MASQVSIWLSVETNESPSRFPFFHLHFHVNTSNCYAEASGQEINFDKSSLSFSKNVSSVEKELVTGNLGVGIGERVGNYLGLPALVGRGKKAVLGFIRDMIIARVNNWNNRFLSRAGREVMLKTILQSIPTYAMGVFLLPKGMGEEIERVMNAYWWVGGARDTKGIRWRRWDDLCVPKKFGGMGFRKLREFNIAMLGKQAWRLIQNQNSLVARIFAAKYYPGKTFLEAKLGPAPSFVWQSIFQTKDLISRGTYWRIGDGQEVSVWRDAWLPKSGNSYIQTPILEGLEEMKVADLIREEGGDWDMGLVESIFGEEDRKQILNIPLSKDEKDDIRIWGREESGEYSVKSGYMELVGEVREKLWCGWTKMWDYDLPPKVKSFFWQLCSGNLPTIAALRERRVNYEETCYLCTSGVETSLHLFGQCSFTKECWQRWGKIVGKDSCGSLLEWVKESFDVLREEEMCQMIIICWQIWSSRNDYCWNNKRTTPSTVIHAGLMFLKNWRQVCDDGGPTKHDVQVGANLWSKPSSGKLKVNVDAALSVDNNSMGFGWIIRDEYGRFVAAKMCSKQGLFSAREAEAMGVREALSWLKDLHLDFVIIETDALQVIHALSKNRSFSAFDLLINDVKVQASSFLNITFQHVKRSATQVSHRLAREAVSQAGCMEWLDIPPIFISDVLAFDD